MPTSPESPHSDAWSPPRRLDGYEILREIGRGGMGVVCLARQVTLDRTVAVKLLHPRWAEDPRLVARFTREAMAAARLMHPNIVQIHDIGMAAGLYYFSMEYVGGRTLADLLAREGRLEPREAAGYVLQAARGLASAHQHGIIHRDVKPGNLVLNDEGLCKVADLGLAKTAGPLTNDAAEADSEPATEEAAPADHALTRPGARMGTPLYMAPEQADPKAAVDHRADIYALGCTFYHLLAGRPAHGGESTREILHRHRSGRPTPPRLLQPDIPEGLQRIVLGMIERDPGRRPASMETVIRSLEDWIQKSAAEGYQPTEAERRRLEESARAFGRSQWAVADRWFTRGLPAIAAALLALSLLLGSVPIAGACLGLLLLPPAGLFLVRGLSRGTPAFRTFRQLLWTNRPADWAVIGVGALLWAGALGVGGLLGVWAGLAILSLAGALVYHLTLEAAVEAERAPALESAQAVLRRARGRGANEEELRRFVWTHAGAGGEDFYEALFGYDALREARSVWGNHPGEGAPARSRRLRENCIRWMERWTRERHAEALESHLRAVTDRVGSAPPGDAPPPTLRETERKTFPEALRPRPRDADWGPLPAAWKPQDTPEGLPARSAPSPAGTGIPSISDPPRQGGAAPRATILSMQPDTAGSSSRNRLFRRHGLLDKLFGARIRFLLGALLLLAAGLWAMQNDVYRLPPAPEPEETTAAPAEASGETLPDGDSGAPADTEERTAPPPSPAGPVPPGAPETPEGSPGTPESPAGAAAERDAEGTAETSTTGGTEAAEGGPAATDGQESRPAPGPEGQPAGAAEALRGQLRRVGQVGRGVLGLLDGETEPLRLPGVGAAIPEPIMALAFNSLAPGLAGLLLLLSAGYPGPKLGIGVLPGVLLILFGPALLILTGAEALLPQALRPATLAMILGACLAVPGWVWGKPKL